MVFPPCICGKALVGPFTMQWPQTDHFHAYSDCCTACQRSAIDFRLGHEKSEQAPVIRVFIIVEEIDMLAREESRRYIVDRLYPHVGMYQKNVHYKRSILEDEFRVRTMEMLGYTPIPGSTIIRVGDMRAEDQYAYHEQLKCLRDTWEWKVPRGYERIPLPPSPADLLTIYQLFSPTNTWEIVHPYLPEAPTYAQPAIPVSTLSS